MVVNTIKSFLLVYRKKSYRAAGAVRAAVVAQDAGDSKSESAPISSRAYLLHRIAMNTDADIL